jgi:3-oxoacyl-[acyl-carrier protein] reductase
LEIKNNTFVITGAAQGLGEAIALSLSRQGAKIALLDVNAEKLDRVQARCVEVGAAECFAFTCDVASETSVARSFASIEEHLGAISGLVNNAGILRDGLLVKVLCGREAASSMIRNQQQGVIINISSISRAGNIGQSNYAAAKSGVAALTTTWARELARHQIRCAAIAPGVFETEMVASMKAEAHERITSAVPLQRTGSVEELAHAIRFIIENDYFSGRILELDGGLRL